MMDKETIASFRWMSARRSLLERIEACLTKEMIVVAVNEWLLDHLYEFRIETEVSNQLMHLNPLAAEEQVKEMALKAFLKRAFQSDLVQSTRIGRDDFVTTFAFSILLFGAPSFVRTKEGALKFINQ